MKRRIWLACVAVVLMLVAACATGFGQRQYGSQAEALSALGEPVRRWTNDDGTTTLEYSTQPYGHTALMLTVDASGIVIRQQDALSDENLARVEKGMTREEVSRLLGQHRSVQTFTLSGEEVWDWNVYNDGPGVATLFNVHFIDGKVVRTSRSYVFPSDGLDGRFMHPGFMSPFSHRHYAYPYPYRLRWPYRWPWRTWYGW